MTGVSFTVELDAATLGRVDAALARLAEDGRAQLIYSLAQLVENQTKERIATEKATPEGRAWAAWSARHARTRRPAQSLLVGESNLLNSVQNYTTADAAVVGSNLIYSAIQQFGGRGIPARPYLGLSDDNRREIEDLVIELIGGVLQ